MDSTLMDPQGNLRSMQVQGDEAVCMVQTQSQNHRQQVESGDPKTVAMAAKDSGRSKHGRTGCHRGNNEKKSLARGGIGVPRTETDAPALTGSPDTPGKQPVPSQEKPWSLPYSMCDLKKTQLEDPDTGPVLKWLESGARPIGLEVAASSPATWHYWLFWESLKIRDGVMFCKISRKDGTGEDIQFIVPRNLKDEIMYQMHESLLSGHLGK